MNNNQLLRTMEDELGKARIRLHSARKSASRFGHYDDCGDDYNNDYREAKAVVEYLELLLPKLRGKIAEPNPKQENK